MADAARQILINRTFEVIEQLDRVHTANDLMMLLADALGDFGFNAFVLTRLPRPPHAILPHFIVNGWPAGWTERYGEAGHHRHDPLARHCMTTSEVFGWSEIPPALVANAKAQQVVAEAAAFKLNDGLCVPLHTALGVGGLSLAGERVELPPGARHMVKLLAFQACLAIERLPDQAGPRPARLSTRERDVLSWTALGKTSHEIGVILGISSHTVGEHLRHVRRKLCTTNNAQSVAEGLRSGELKL